MGPLPASAGRSWRWGIDTDGTVLSHQQQAATPAPHTQHAPRPRRPRLFHSPTRVVRRCLRHDGEQCVEATGCTAHGIAARETWRTSAAGCHPRLLALTAGHATTQHPRNRGRVVRAARLHVWLHGDICLLAHAPAVDSSVHTHAAVSASSQPAKQAQRHSLQQRAALNKRSRSSRRLSTHCMILTGPLQPTPHHITSKHSRSITADHSTA